jgi:hypothetical protein
MTANERNINECTGYQIATHEKSVRNVGSKKIRMMIKKRVETKCQQKCLKGSKLNQIFLIWS